MNVKIQGGGNGTYANTGSCVAVTNYLQHEDLERMKKGEEVQPFFNQFRDYVSSREVTFKIDNNKAKLSQTDARFYVIRQPFRERAALHGQDSAGACGSLAVVHPAGRDEKLCGGLRKRLEKR